MAMPPLQVPREPFFLELFQRWKDAPQKTLIRDHAADRKESNVGEFLYDVLTLRERIYDDLDEHIKERLCSPDVDVYIAVLAHAGYEFAVLTFAIYSLGAVTVPLSPEILLEEAKYFLELCDSVLLTTVPREHRQAKAISDSLGIKLLAFDSRGSQASSEMTFSLKPDGTTTNPEKGFVLLFTSGTTGLPKGVLHSRQGAYAGLESQVQSFGLSKTDTWLHHSPVHWGAGFTLLVANIISGACVELCSTVFNLEWLLGRLQDGCATCLYLPSFHLDAFASRISTIHGSWSTSRYEALLSGVQGLRVLCSGAVRISSSTLAFWRNLRGGQPIVIVYAMTESLSLIATTDWKSDAVFPEGCCGFRTPGVKLKVNETGEVFIQAPSLFKRYLSNKPDIMNGVLDSEGSFKTGDVGRLEGDLVFIYGRADHDVIRVYGWKLFAPDLEETLSNHPMVSQAIVLGVPHRTTGQQVAVLLVAEGTQHTTHLSLWELRKWLAVGQDFPVSKLPTMLCVIGSGETIPTTSSGKVIKPKIRDFFFNETEIKAGKIEVCDLFEKIPGRDDRPFDWSGMQEKHMYSQA